MARPILHHPDLGDLNLWDMSASQLTALDRHSRFRLSELLEVIDRQPVTLHDACTLMLNNLPNIWSNTVLHASDLRHLPDEHSVMAHWAAYMGRLTAPETGYVAKWTKGDGSCLLNSIITSNIGHKLTHSHLNSSDPLPSATTLRLYLVLAMIVDPYAPRIFTRHAGDPLYMEEVRRTADVASYLDINHAAILARHMRRPIWLTSPLP